MNSILFIYFPLLKCSNLPCFENFYTICKIHIKSAKCDTLRKIRQIGAKCNNQLVVNFKSTDYQLFNGTIVYGVSKGVHNLTITHNNSSNPLLPLFHPDHLPRTLLHPVKDDRLCEHSTLPASPVSLDAFLSLCTEP